MPYITARRVAVSEGSPFVDFIVRLDAPVLNEVRVSYQTDAGSATYSGSQDFVYQAGTLIFAPGETTKTVRVILSDGTTAESTEVFWLDLYSPVNAVVLQRWTPAIIFDNDGPTGTPSLRVHDVVVDETSRTADLVVSLSRPSATAVTVNYAAASDSAVAGQDFTATSGTLTFAPGEMVKTVSVNLIDDSVPERDEIFRLVLSNPSGATLANGGVGTALIGRNDDAPVSQPYIISHPLAVSEGEIFANFVVQLSAPSMNEVRINYQTDAGTATYSSNQDFVYQTGTLVFAPGETTKTVPILISDGTAAEATEVFWLDLSTPVNAIVPVRWTPATVYDNDGASGTPAISVGDLIVDESTHAAHFFVSLSRASASTVTVNYATADGTAKAGQDYAATSGALSFVPGEMVKTVRVDLIDDSIAERDEVFKLVLSNPAGATLANGGVGSALIGASDTPAVSTPYILSRPIAVGEGETYAHFVVQLSAPSMNEVRVNYQTDAGTATYSSNQDFIYQTGTLVFAPGETTKTVPILISDGTVAERTEVFWLDLYTPVNAIVPVRWTPAIIVDNDGTTGTPGVWVSDAVVDESAQWATFFVSLNRASTATVTVNFGTADDTAVAAQDYVAASGTLSFAPGETVKTVMVEIVNDNLAEGDEFFKLLLSNPTGATLVDPIGAGMIGRNDTAAVSRPQILVQPITVSEADMFADFIVQLSAPSMNEVRVNYQTDAGTATYSSNQDFIYQTGTLVFAPGETTKMVRVLLSDGTVAEPTEVFAIDLYSPVNATIPQRYTAATILDNDGPGSVFSYGISNDRYTVTSALDRIAESPGGGVDTVFAALSYTLPENVENLVLTGAAPTNAIGNAGNNVLRGNGANNVLDGQGGIDTAVFSGPIAAYTISAGPNQSRIVSGGGDGTDTLVSIERLQFADVLRASDTSPGGNVYLAYAMFNAGFNRGPDVNELSLWASTLDRVGNTRDLAQAMINYYAPGVPDEVLVAHLWGTIVGTPIPISALAQYTGLLVDGTFTQASLLEFVAVLSLNIDEIVQIVGTTIDLSAAFFAAPG